MRYKRETMRQRLNQMLSNLGSRLDSIDRAYVNQIQKGYDPHKNPLAGMTGGTVLSDIYRYPSQADSIPEHIVEQLMGAGILGANVASRYALPVGGVTLAGAGLMELAQMLSSKEGDEVV